MIRLKNFYVYLTWKCNLLCKHCWVDANVNDDRQTLDTPTLLKTCDEALDLGVQFVKFSGGEPLLCAEQLLSAAKHIKNRNNSVVLHLETNATLITPDYANKLALFDSVSVSLDSAQAKTHNQLRQNVHAFQDAIRGIDYLVANNVNVSVTSVVSEPERIDDQITDLIELLKSIGVRKLKINPIMRNGRAEQSQTDFYNIDPLDMLDIQSKYIDSKDVEVVIMLPCAFNFNPNKVTESKFHSCDCLSLISLLPNGDVGLCGEARKASELMFGNIYENSLSYIWEKSKKIFELRSVVPNNMSGVCQTCLLKSICRGGCRVDGLLSGGSIGSSSFICQSMYERGLFPLSVKSDCFTSVP